MCLLVSVDAGVYNYLKSYFIYRRILLIELWAILHIVKTWRKCWCLDRLVVQKRSWSSTQWRNYFPFLFQLSSERSIFQANMYILYIVSISIYGNYIINGIVHNTHRNKCLCISSVSCCIALWVKYYVYYVCISLSSTTYGSTSKLKPRPVGQEIYWYWPTQDAGSPSLGWFHSKYKTCGQEVHDGVHVTLHPADSTWNSTMYISNDAPWKSIKLQL